MTDVGSFVLSFSLSLSLSSFCNDTTAWMIAGFPPRQVAILVRDGLDCPGYHLPPYPSIESPPKTVEWKEGKVREKEKGKKREKGKEKGKT